MSILSYINDTLALALDGQHAKRNEVILANATCDRSFIFSPGSVDFVPILAVQFWAFT